MLFRTCLSVLATICLLTNWSHAQQAANPMESLINQQVNRYALSTSNRFRLAAYLELEGEVSYTGSVNLNFGNLGSFVFYPDNCLLRTQQSGIYHITPRDTYSKQVTALNDALDRLFERISLLSNGDATGDHVRFVDRHLGPKNLDSFHKLYVRYLLIHYGEFDPVAQRVSLHTDAMRADGLIDPTVSYEPLAMYLDTLALHGSYLRTGGLVYVQNVDRDVSYATGEKMTPNVGAFKLFLRKFLGGAVSYITQGQTRSKRSKVSFQKTTSRQATGSRTSNGVEPLYSEYSWIPMMLNMLRSNDLSFGDPDILQYFVDAPYLDRIYDQLTPEERRQVDAYLENI